jgi:NAD(P)-dependent dehydrogenase (short-subunit alcohol dehydrogenase family)
MSAQMPLAGRVALITGANVGIGRVTAIELAKAGAQLVIAGRSAQRTQPVLDAISALPNAKPALFLPLELASLKSVRECADAFTALGLPLHLLINNAGLAGARGMTQDGFEMTFGVNHLGHFLLTQKLLPVLQRSGTARVITVSSRAHTRTSGIDWGALRQPTRTRTGIREYAVSKLANLLFSAELARRLADSDVSTYSLHPGVVATEVWRALPGWVRPLLPFLGMLTPEQGARTTLHCAMVAPQSETGLYYADCHPVPPAPLGQDAHLARELWQRSESWVAS